MGILEIVFNSRKFDLNDDVLMGFDNYFDKKSKDYNSFCLDGEDINPLQNFVAQIKSADSDSVIYVSTYGYSDINSRMPRHSCCEVRVMQLHDILLLRTSAILPEAISAGR